MKTAKIFMATMLMAISLFGCASATRKVNRRAVSHIKYHAAKKLSCEEKLLNATCVKEYKSGECYQYEIIGCNSGIVYKNVNGSGWIAGS